MGKDKMEKAVMGKDSDGTFHPGKGKPSGINKEEGLGLKATETEKLENYLDTTDKYTAGEDILADHVAIRHPNRNSMQEENETGARRKNGRGKRSIVAIENQTITVPEQLPGVFTKQTFGELANFKDGLTISIYIPTHRAGVEVNEHFDHVACKNILNTVAQQLREKGNNQTQIDLLLRPGFDLIGDHTFWLDLTDGLAVFIAEGIFKYVKMPVVPVQKIVIEPTFYVTPLVPLLTSSEYFYLLTISKKTIKLFKGDAFGMHIVPVELPQGIEEVKRISETDATTFRQGESGRRTAAFASSGQSHGAGGGNPDDKDKLATYFEAVDDILWQKVFNKENAPLVLAGVEYEIPVYKSVCDYHNVWDASLTGNREYQETASLYKDAMEVMKPYFNQAKLAALEMYGNKSATQLTSPIVDDVIPAAYYGRVSHLFVLKGKHVWGTFDEMANKLETHENVTEKSEDLVDNAVVKTLANGGEVFVLDDDEMPCDSTIAGLLRY